MKLGNVLNDDRVKSLRMDQNAYTNTYKSKADTKNVNIQRAEKVLFPQPYENASAYYNRKQFSPLLDDDCKKDNCDAKSKSSSQTNPMFDVRSLLPILAGGKFNDMLNPLISMIGGGANKGGFDFAKIFELLKPKKNTQKEKKEEDISSKFDDFVVIED